MSLFLLTFLSIYLAMHALAFWGMYPLLANHRFLLVPVLFWMGLMLAAPVLVRVLDGHGLAAAARALAWIGYSWMGLLFLAFCVLAVFGFWHLLALLLKAFRPAMPLWSPYGTTFSALVLLGVALAGVYGFFEARNLRVEKVVLSTAKLSAGSPPLRLVQVSDVHLGLLHREEALAPIIARIRELRPDLLVATGDMVDAQMDHLNGLSALWQGIAPPLGKFAVTGNHEYYAGLEQAMRFLQRSGFRVLRQEMVTVGGTIVVAGVDDPTGRSLQDETALLNEGKGDLFTLLLKHRPRIEEKSLGLFDLQLSGHAHRGQIFPFNLLTGVEYPRQDGLYDLDRGSRLYTSRGTGTWGPPMRIGSPPEITLFEIVGTGE